MKLRTIAIAASLAFLAHASHATGNHTPKEPPSKPTPTPAPPAQTPVYVGGSPSAASSSTAAGGRADSASVSGAQSGSNASSGASVGNTSAAGGQGGAGGNASTSSTSASGDSNAASTNTMQDSSSFWSQSRALGLTFAPGAFTPPLPAINNPCSPTVTQSARGLGMGILSRADAKTDPRICHIVERRNNAWRECRYATAKQIDDLLMAEMLPGFKPPAETYLKDNNDPGFVDFSPQHCALLTTPPPKPPEPVQLNWIYVPPPVARVEDKPAEPIVPASPKPRKPVARKASPPPFQACGDGGVPQCIPASKAGMPRT